MNTGNRNPPFNEWRESTVATQPPPYNFRDVVFRYFPLEADLTSLQILCDSYLNIAPKFAYFRPAMPYVFLCVGHYGDMQVTSSRFGWSSQYEYFFSVPIEWYSRKDDEWQFEALASFTPFIFLDNEYAELDGREMYGWPKAQSWLTKTKDGWAGDPLAPRRPMTFQTRVLKQLYNNQRQEIRDFMVVEELPAYSPSEFPPGGSASPWQAWAGMMDRWSGAYTSAMMNWSGSLVREMTNQTPEGLPPYGLETLEAANEFMSTLVLNTINLKQIRDIRNPTEYCYQAITRASLQVSQLRRSGLVGDLAQYSGDLTGGYRIRLHRYPSHPIVETLGLKLDPASTDEVSVLAPLAPFWQRLDWSFQDGDRICWRTRYEDWRTASSPPAEPPPLKDRGYVTTGVLDYQVATGPFRFHDSTIRILPLLARQEALETICDQYINSNGADEYCRVEPFGRYVFCVVTSFGPMISQTDNFGQWAESDVQFLIPVRRFVKDRLVGLGVLNPFSYSNSDIGVSTAREVFGWTTNLASITPGASEWLGGGDLSGAHQELMRVGTEVWPGPGQHSQWADLIRVVRRKRKDGEIKDVHYQRLMEAEESRLQTAEGNYESEIGKLSLLALELLLNGQPINFLALKQFRNAGDPTMAAFQELAQLPLAITTLKGLKQERRPLDLVMLPVPTQPIAERLGLVEHAHEFDGAPAQVFRSYNPVYAHVDLQTLPGKSICWRAGGEPWNPGYRQGQEAEMKVRAVSDTSVSGALLEALLERKDDDSKDLHLNLGEERPMSSESALEALTQPALEPIMLFRRMASRLPKEIGSLE